VQISSRHVDQLTIFDITGDIDLATSPELRLALLREIRERRRPRVIVNLTQVRYMDSSGLASLIEALKASKDSGTRFALFGLSAHVREVIHLSKLTHFFEIHDDEEGASAP